MYTLATPPSHGASIIVEVTEEYGASLRKCGCAVYHTRADAEAALAGQGAKRLAESAASKNGKLPLAVGRADRQDAKRFWRD